jgi:hypothetical protein
MSSPFRVKRYGEDPTDRSNPTDRTDLLRAGAKEDARPFWRRLVSSLRLTAKVKKKAAEVHLSGGAEF